MDITSSNDARAAIESGWAEADFLALKQVNKRGKVRLNSPITSLEAWTGKTDIFAISNKLGCFAAGGDQSVVAGTLQELRSACADDAAPFAPRKTIQLQFKPIIIKFARGDENLVVCQQNGKISVFATKDIADASVGQIQPVYEFTHTADAILDLQPNPADRPELLAVLRGAQDSSRATRIEMIDLGTFNVSAWAAPSPDQSPSCMHWSPRGKQLVVGDRAGQLRQHTPDGQVKATISRPSTLPSDEQRVVSSVYWLENTVFYATYANSEDPPLLDSFVIITDSQNPADIVLGDLAAPFGDHSSRVPARLHAYFKAWGSMKHILVVADAPSTDIVVLGCFADPARQPSPWAPLELDDTARPTLPTDDNGGDSCVLGLDVDLTATDQVTLASSGGEDTPPAPPAPILYLYTNEGIVVAYHVLNSEHPQYPGMTARAPAATNPQPSTPKPTSIFGQPSSSTFGAPSLSAPSASPFGQATAKPVFGQTGFGGAPAFGAPSPFGTAASKPVFGQTGFSSFGAAPAAKPTTAPTFGAPTALGAGTSFASAASAIIPQPVAVKPGGGFAGFSGLGGFGALASQKGPENVFAGGSSGSGGFGSSTGQTPLAFGNTAPVTAPAFSGFRDGVQSPASAAPTPPVFGGFGSSAQTQPASRPLGFAGFGAQAQSPAATPASAPTKSIFAPAGDSLASFGSTDFGLGGEASSTRAPDAGMGTDSPPLSPPSNYAVETVEAEPDSPLSQSREWVFASAPPETAPVPAPAPAPVSAPTSASAPASALGFGALSIFGSAPASTSTPPAPTPAPAPAPAPAPSSSPSIFGQPSIFGPKPSSPSPAAESKPTSIFGSSAPTTTTPTSPGPAGTFGGFGSAAVSPGTKSIFGGTGFGFGVSSPSPALTPPASNPLGEAQAPKTLEPSTPTKPVSVFGGFGSGGGASTTPPGAPKSMFGAGQTFSVPSKPGTLPASSGLSGFSGFAVPSGSSVSFGSVANKGGESGSSFGDLLSGAKGGDAPRESSPPVEQAQTQKTPPGSASLFGGPSLGNPPVTPEKPAAVSAGAGGATPSTPTQSLAERLGISLPDKSVSDSPRSPPGSPPPGGEDSPSGSEGEYEEDGEEEGEEGDELEELEELDDGEGGEGEEEEGEGEEEGEEEEEGGTTPPGSPPRALSLPPKLERQTSEPVKPSAPPAAVPSTRSPSVPPRLFGNFSNAPARSSPLGASPPISRNDLEYSPEKPDPNRAGGGFFRKLTEPSPEDDEEEEKALQALVREKTGTKPATLTPAPVEKPPSPFTRTPSPFSPSPSSASGSGSTLAPVPVRPSSPAPLVAPIASPPPFAPSPTDQSKNLPRSKTPPLLSTAFAPPKPKADAAAPPSLFGPPAAPAPKPAGFLFPPPPVPAPAPAPGPLSFALPPANQSKAAPPPSFTSFGGFGAKPKSEAAPPPLFGSPAVPASKPNFFPPPSTSAPLFPGSAPVPAPIAVPASSPFLAQMPQKPATAPAQALQFAPPQAAPLAPAAPQAPRPAEKIVVTDPGINGEVDRMIIHMTAELDVLQANMKKWSMFQHQIGQPKPLPRTPQHLASAIGWTLGDLKALRRLTISLETEVRLMADDDAKAKQRISEIQELSLRAATLEQQAARFVEAREDKEFAQILQVRELGPEQEENRARLQKLKQVVEDRVRQMEERLVMLKKQEKRFRSGESSIKAPSLDTIARIIHNIQQGTNSKSGQIENLNARISRLAPLSRPSRASSPFVADPRAVDPTTKSVAVKKGRASIAPRAFEASARALDAERLGERLKGALLSARKEPLLTTAVIARSADSEPVTFALASIDGAGAPRPANQPSTPFSGPFTPLGSPISPSSSPSPSSGRERSGRGRRSNLHSPSIRFTGGARAAASSSFDFGPLPPAPPVRNQLAFSFSSLKPKNSANNGD